MTDEAPSQTRTAVRSTSIGTPALADHARAGQPRLDEIGRAVGFVRRRLEAAAGTHPVSSHLRPVTGFNCPTCGHERWTATGCAICALLGSVR